MNNCRKTNKLTEKNASAEIQSSKLHWRIRQLQKDNNGILICVGKISGEHPIYVPDKRLVHITDHWRLPSL